MTRAWETAARYHNVHAVALLALAALACGMSDRAPKSLSVAAWSWTIGIVLFSGSLYALALGGPHPLVYVTPLGGIALLIGWAAVIVAGLSARSNSSPRP